MSGALYIFAWKICLKSLLFSTFWCERALLANKTEKRNPFAARIGKQREIWKWKVVQRSAFLNFGIAMDKNFQGWLILGEFRNNYERNWFISDLYKLTFKLFWTIKVLQHDFLSWFSVQNFYFVKQFSQNN